MKYITLEMLNSFATKFAAKITATFVKKESGKGLSTNDYTTAEKDKLKGLNNTVVDSALSGTSTNPLQNKAVNEALNAKVPTARKVNNKVLSTDITLTAADVGALAAGTKGAANGVAELDANGTVPSSQLPSYVDDVLEYTARASFPGTGETGKIYVDTTANKTYRWSGSTYVVISDTIALGETSSTAYRGDLGKTAYTHSQSAHAPSNAEANVQADWNVTDTNSDAFIKNKPSFAGTSHSHTCANISDLETATDADIDGIIAGTFT